MGLKTPNCGEVNWFWSWNKDGPLCHSCGRIGDEILMRRINDGVSEYVKYDT
jgi:uncharacterized protein (DUF983 family)